MQGVYRAHYSHHCVVRAAAGGRGERSEEGWGGDRMQCPKKRDVGTPPSIAACPDGWEACECSRLMWGYAFGFTNDDTFEVVGYWQEHPNHIYGKPAEP